MTEHYYEHGQDNIQGVGRAAKSGHWTCSTGCFEGIIIVITTLFSTHHNIYISNCQLLQWGQVIPQDVGFFSL